FVFHLTKEEFMQIFFDDLALPRRMRTQLAETPEMKTQRAGYSNQGTPSNLSVIRSMRGAISRRVAIGSGSRAELIALEARLRELPEPRHAAEELAKQQIETQIALLRARLDRIPYVDPIDLRFRNRVRVPVPTAKAVMFCLMDVSGSMDEIINARYSPTDWNIYAAQASDGDNWHHDSGRCRELLTESLLPKCRYFAYVQVADEEQNLWEEYARLQEVQKHFAMRKVTQASQIYPVFRDLFKAEGAAK